MTEPVSHPLLPLLLAAAHGHFPPVDGLVDLVPPLTSELAAVVSFTGHAVIATSLPAADLADLPLDGYGAALQPAVLLRLAGCGGTVGVLDATLVGRGLGGGRLPRRHDLDHHPRVRHAYALRTDVQVYGDERGLITVAKGLAGRTELSVATTDGLAGMGVGRTLIQDGLRLVGAGEPVFAAVSPGNARSLRTFLALGFQVLGSEVLILRAARGRRVAGSH